MQNIWKTNEWFFELSKTDRRMGDHYGPFRAFQVNTGSQMHRCTPLSLAMWECTCKEFEYANLKFLIRRHLCLFLSFWVSGPRMGLIGHLCLFLLSWLSGSCLNLVRRLCLFLFFKVFGSRMDFFVVWPSFICHCYHLFILRHLIIFQ